MKVCAISDIHGTLLPIEDYFEPCDLVCICGDISPLDIQSNNEQMEKWMRESFKPWCESLPCDKVLFIAGNHDFFLNNKNGLTHKLFSQNEKVTYLLEESYFFEKNNKTYHIYGTPYCRMFGRWPFMRTEPDLEEKYDKIPENLDILLTHDQPYGYGDILQQEDFVYYNGRVHVGNKVLTKYIKVKEPRYIFTGHLHTTTHDCVMINNTKKYNVSIKDESYDPVYDPLIIDIE